MDTSETADRRYVLRHVRSTRRAGLSVLLTIGSLAVGLIVLQRTCFPELGDDHPWLIRLLYISLALNVLAALAYVVLNLRTGGEFICQLDDEFLECISPVPSCGESFRITIADIAKVEQWNPPDSHSWYVYDLSGKRHWLTDCYDNPAGAFVALVKERNPTVVEVES